MALLTISIDRTSLALDPLVLVGDKGSTTNTKLAISAYQEPSRQARVRRAPPSDHVHGDLALGWNWQQSALSFVVVALEATEAEGKAAVLELEEAVARLSYSVTVTVGTAPPYTWTCDPGSVTATRNRTRFDVRSGQSEWSVELPCHPVPEIGA